MRRERMLERERPMTHLVVDECQNFITPSIVKIIEETRKFGLAVTLAQLTVGRGMSPEMAHVVSEIPNVRVVGRAGRGETRRSGELVGVDPDDIERLDIGQFFYRAGTAPTFLLHGRSDLVGWRHRMEAVDWGYERTRQLATYYRQERGDPALDEAPASAGVDAPESAERVKKKKRKLV